jgi:hypothetical protein
MGYRGQSGSRRGAGEKFQKSSHEKAKSKAKKNKSGNFKYAPEEVLVQSEEEVMEKTLGSLNRFGSQKFALSPFSQYFDDWLLNMRQVVSEFEASPAITVDEAFVKERTQMLADVEGELAKRKLKETELETSAKALAENNHLLVEIDANYAAQTKELAQKRNSSIELLTKNVHALEEEFSLTEQIKTSFLNPFAKKTKTQKKTEITQKLDTAKKELELAMQGFGIEQEKFHDEYAKKKQAVLEKVQSLEKEIVNIETDSSLETRQTATNALGNAVKALIQRKPVPSQ